MMPFDEQDTTEIRPNDEESKPKRPGPILHTPKSGPDIPFKIIIPIILIIAVGIGGFWYYKQKQKKQTQNPPVVVNMGSSDTTQTGIESTAIESPPETTAIKEQQPSERRKKQQSPTNESTPLAAKNDKQKKSITITEPKAEKPGESSKVSLSTHGKFSIIIGSFKDKKNADALFGQRKEAGYPAYLTTKGTWHRVSLGRYPTFGEAHKAAEKMRDILPDGYIIDTIE